jgi:hypothetical protein
VAVRQAELFHFDGDREAVRRRPSPPLRRFKNSYKLMRELAHAGCLAV